MEDKTTDDDEQQSAVTTLIQAHDVTKDYHIGGLQVRALDNVSLSIGKGEFVALMGPSGSGKSTLLHLLGGLDRPTQGQVIFAGQEITALNPRGLSLYRRRRVGFMFQNFNLIGTLTALENVAFPLIFSGVPERERKARAARALVSVGLADRMDHRPTELSGGQQQRVAVARALVADAPLILADEPTGNLDTASGESIMQLLAELNQGGRTIVVVTHDPRMSRFASRSVQLLDGRITE
ncbi:MAG: ABC transporter ATP-binding protein [Chloroflexi bacterium]|nr:ABC transporter ATP-binding protein [Chloroflexota bacterium]